MCLDINCDGWVVVSSWLSVSSLNFWNLNCFTGCNCLELLKDFFRFLRLSKGLFSSSDELSELSCKKSSIMASSSSSIETLYYFTNKQSTIESYGANLNSVKTEINESADRPIIASALGSLQCVFKEKNSCTCWLID